MESSYYLGVSFREVSCGYDKAAVRSFPAFGITDEPSLLYPFDTGYIILIDNHMQVLAGITCPDMPA